MTETETKEYPTASRSYNADQTKPLLLPKEVQEYAFLKAAVSEIGGCLTDIGIVLAQGIREDNAAKRGGIAAGLRRAAAYVEGHPFVIVPPAETLPITAADLKKSLERKAMETQRELKVENTAVDEVGNVTVHLTSEPILSGEQALAQMFQEENIWNGEKEP